MPADPKSTVFNQVITMYLLMLSFDSVAPFPSKQPHQLFGDLSCILAYAIYTPYHTFLNLIS
jgi:purine-cytosine permease-like protein